MTSDRYASWTSERFEQELLQAAKHGHLQLVTELLECIWNVNYTDDDECTALYYAAKRGDEKMVKILIASEAWVVSISEFHPIIEAARGGHASIVRLLLDHNANIHVRDRSNKTALMMAATYGHTRIVRMLLENGADVNAHDTNGDTALIYAACHGYTAIVRMLLVKGANVNARCDQGTTALIETVLNGYLDVARLLLLFNADVNVQDSSSRTALMEAAIYGYTEIVMLLLGAGADTQLTDDLGDTARMLAEQREHLGCIRALGGVMELFNTMEYAEDNCVNDTCSICLISFIDKEKIIELSCLHNFHEACITMWCNGKPSCPLCRQPIVMNISVLPSVPSVILPEEPIRYSSVTQSDPVSVFVAMNRIIDSVH